jgi:predicted RNA binding protein YcfA (HicA-like mRNA interferase family)
MSRLGKLIERIRRRPSEADYSDVRRLLQAFDWHVDRQSGSHITFVKAGELPIVIPLVGGRKVKRGYLDQICDALRLDDWEEKRTS